MDIVNGILGWIVDGLSFLLPKLNLGGDFLNMLDSSMSVLITLINWGGYFIPLNVLSICFGTIILFDNFSIIMRIAQWIIGLIRG